jgi:hypothetical protein
MGRRGPKPQFTRRIEFLLSDEDVAELDLLTRLTAQPQSVCARAMFRLGARVLRNHPAPQDAAIVAESAIHDAEEATTR